MDFFEYGKVIREFLIDKQEIKSNAHNQNTRSDEYVGGRKEANKS